MSFRKPFANAWISSFVVSNGGSSPPTPPVDPDFVFTVKTDNLSTGSTTSTQFKVPTTTSGSPVYDCVVDWGDNTTSTIASATDAAWTHTYPSAGTYQIRISGTFTRILFNGGGDRLKLLSIDNWGTNQWVSMSGAFRGCANLTTLPSDTPDFSNVLFLNNMFYDCSNLDGDISNFDVPSATSLSGMFLGCVKFNQSVAHFNTSNTTNFRDMFSNCTLFKQSLANFDVSKVTDNYFGLNNILFGVTLPTADYDATLISWAAQSVNPGLVFTAGSSKYSTAAAAARTTLTSSPNNWTITDGGPA